MLRRTFLHSAAGLTGLAAAATPAWAVVEININKGNVEPLPIAVTDFVSSGDLGVKIGEPVDDRHETSEAKTSLSPAWRGRSSQAVRAA